MLRYVGLLNRLPPLVAALVWDVINYRVSRSTLDLARQASEAEKEAYDLVRLFAAGSPDFLEFHNEYGKIIVDKMVDQVETSSKE